MKNKFNFILLYKSKVYLGHHIGEEQEFEE